MKLKLTIDGKLYEVEVEVSEPDPLQPSYIPPIAQGVVLPAIPVAVAPPATANSVADDAKVCRSPFAGTVVRIPAEVGQAIQAGDTLMVLEAMKMEAVITSPHAGKISKINVSVGDAVQGGQVLVEFA